MAIIKAAIPSMPLMIRSVLPIFCFIYILQYNKVGLIYSLKRVLSTSVVVYIRKWQRRDSNLRPRALIEPFLIHISLNTVIFIHFLQPPNLQKRHCSHSTPITKAIPIDTWVLGFLNDAINTIGMGKWAPTLYLYPLLFNIEGYLSQHTLY